jgi:hypothetical protein
MPASSEFPYAGLTESEMQSVLRIKIQHQENMFTYFNNLQELE